MADTLEQRIAAQIKVLRDAPKYRLGWLDEDVAAFVRAEMREVVKGLRADATTRNRRAGQGYMEEYQNADTINEAAREIESKYNL